MELRYLTFNVDKRFALTISRGITTHSTNIWVKIYDSGYEGWGEASPFSVVKEGKNDTEKLLSELSYLSRELEKFHPRQRLEIEKVLIKNKVSTAVRAAIDMALYDWIGKKAGLPLWYLWGLDLRRIVPTSVTVGISSPNQAKERVRNWQELMDVNIIKVKLGSKEGIEADQAMLLAIRDQAPEAKLTVDANGGWNLEQAIFMCDWLAQQGVQYVEQPLAVGEEDNLSVLYGRSPLAIFVDESCFNSQDILRLADCVHGINIKIMKAGGLTEAMRMINIAQACGLKIMYGCYSDSSLANTAMSHLGPLANYIDLDSHLNLINDPFSGVILEKGRLLPKDLPGLGVEYGENKG